MNRFTQRSKLPFEQSEAAKQDCGIEQISLQRVMEERDRGHITGDKTVVRFRVKRSQGPDAEIRDQEEENGTGERRASDMERRPTLLEPKPKAYD